jgi:hypothetical protein
MQGDLCTQKICKAKAVVLWLRQPLLSAYTLLALSVECVLAVIRFSWAGFGFSQR